MSTRAPSLRELEAALHPLHAVPAGAAWNEREVEGMRAPGVSLVQSAVLVPLVERQQMHVLLTRRTDALRHHAGQVSFPGGRIDAADADAAAAALREAREEIGLAAAQARLLGYLDPLCTVTGYRVLPLVALLCPDFVPVPEPGEVADVFEVPLGWLLAPENLQRTPMEYAGRTREVLEFRRHAGSAGQRVWGATASILFNLRERLSQTREGGS